LIANEKALSVYANDVRLTNASIGKLARGKIAFYVCQESGTTTCLFTNGWLWNLK
jgi:hypothetical protein